MKPLYPEILKRGDHIRIIAPSLSMHILSQDTIQCATDRFSQMGFTIS
jgi:muramoyltetrapeptide carboxypeptidase LdcA involved in peptidoglycan recycling